MTDAEGRRWIAKYGLLVVVFGYHFAEAGMSDGEAQAAPRSLQWSELQASQHKCWDPIMDTSEDYITSLLVLPKNRLRAASKTI